MEKRDALKVWTILLAILAFSLSPPRHLPRPLRRAHLGAHLRRPIPTRGVFILAILASSSAARSRSSPSGRRRCAGRHLRARSAARARSSSTTCSSPPPAATVLVGTLYPLVLEALTGDTISVGAPFFNLTFVPLVMPLLLILPFGPMLAWKRGDLRGAAERLVVRRSASASLAAIAAAWPGGARRTCSPLFGVAARHLADRRRAVGDRVRIKLVSRRRSAKSCAALARPAALRLRHDAGPCRRRRHGARHRRRQHLATETILTMRPGDDVTVAGLRRSSSTASSCATGRTTRETVVRFTVREAGSVDRGDGAGQAAVRGAPDRRRPRRRSRPSACRSSTSSLGDIARGQGAVGPHLLEAAGDAHLARRRRHGARRRPVAERPAAPGRRAAAGARKPVPAPAE